MILYIPICINKCEFVRLSPRLWNLIFLSFLTLNMPLKHGKNYFQFGDHGKKYPFKAGNKIAEGMAKGKALKQGRAIEWRKHGGGGVGIIKAAPKMQKLKALPKMKKM